MLSSNSLVLPVPPGVDSVTLSCFEADSTVCGTNRVWSAGRLEPAADGCCGHWPFWTFPQCTDGKSPCVYCTSKQQHNHAKPTVRTTNNHQLQHVLLVWFMTSVSLLSNSNQLDVHCNRIIFHLENRISQTGALHSVSLEPTGSLFSLKKHKISRDQG